MSGNKEYLFFNNAVDRYQTVNRTLLIKLQQKRSRSLPLHQRFLPNMFPPPQEAADIRAIEEIIENRDYTHQFFTSRALSGMNSGSIFEPDHIPYQANTIRHAIPKIGPPKGAQIDLLYDLFNKDNPVNGVIINTLPTSSAHLWDQLQETDIPVAPILLDKKGQPRMYDHPDGFSRVYSRFCGLSVSTIQNVIRTSRFPSHLMEDRDRLVHHVTTIDNFNDFLRKQWQGISKAVTDIGLKHGHDVEPNFTVEFIKRQYLEEQLEQGCNINSISYDSDHWSFDPNEYLNHQDDWKVVTRLIDFDNIEAL